MHSGESQFSVKKSGVPHWLVREKSAHYYTFSLVLSEIVKYSADWSPGYKHYL